MCLRLVTFKVLGFKGQALFKYRKNTGCAHSSGAVNLTDAASSGKIAQILFLQMSGKAFYISPHFLDISNNGVEIEEKYTQEEEDDKQDGRGSHKDG